MYFRSVAELNDDVVAWCRRLPPDIDLVAGIPRSGLLVANLLSLHRNLPMTDVDGLLAERLVSSGARLDAPPDLLRSGRRLRILVVDDSVWSGGQMAKTRARIAAAGIAHDVRYGAVYVVPKAARLVDFYGRKLPLPRAFEWNVLHHPFLQESCVAGEGVLWPNAPGWAWEGPPLFTPTQTIGWLVATQPEAARPAIERWLADHGIRYQTLALVAPADLRGGRDWQAVARDKAALYRQSNGWIFVEARPTHAASLARTARRPVYCVARRKMLYPGRGGDARYTARVQDRLLWRGQDLLSRVYSKARMLGRLAGLATRLPTG